MKYRIWNKTLDTWVTKGNTEEIIESEDKDFIGGLVNTCRMLAVTSAIPQEKEYEFEMRSYPEDNER